jgi:hypothetical protein
MHAKTGSTHKCKNPINAKQTFVPMDILRILPRGVAAYGPTNHLYASQLFLCQFQV